MWRNRMHASRMFLGLLWAGGSSTVVPVVGSWTRLPRSADAWTRIDRVS